MNPLRSSHLSSGAADSFSLYGTPRRIKRKWHSHDFNELREARTSFSALFFFSFCCYKDTKQTLSSRERKHTLRKLIMIIIIDCSGNVELEFS